MIAAITNQNFQRICISTGNILNNKLGQKSNEELLDGLKLTLQCDGCNEMVTDSIELNESEGKVMRATQELNQKITENDRPEISIGAKIFLNRTTNGAANIEAAVNALLQILKVQYVDNIVLAYHPEPRENCNLTPTTPNVSNSNDSGGSGSGSASAFKWHSRNEKSVGELTKLWSTLEQFALDKRILQLGVSDLDAETLKQIFEIARVKPSIAQINLSSCCVVPPTLQEFCTQHDIQLLTHSDPEALLPTNEQFIIPGYKSDWICKYQVHVRCRGVLTAKGYLVGASKQEVD